MTELIRKYLIEEKRIPAVAAERTMLKLEQHPNNSSEMEHWIADRTDKSDGSVRVEGYTAADIVKLAPFMEGVGAFAFLVSLREQPDRAKEQIAAGFPRK